MKKPLRFIIADEQHQTRLHVEQLLNSLGYYSIVPVSSFEDVAVLSHCGHEMFDGLIVNAALLPKDLFQIFGVGRIRSTLVYEHKGLCSPHAQWRTPRICLRVGSIPGRDLLAHWFGE